MAIQRSIGEKAGLLTMTFGMCVGGFVVGFWKGWALSFTLLAIAPAIGACGYLYMHMLSGGSSAGMRAYSQSAGYAEQAFSAIRVVVAFGMESVEHNNYTAYLT